MSTENIILKGFFEGYGLDKEAGYAALSPIGDYRAARKTIHDPEEIRKHWDIKQSWDLPENMIGGGLLGGLLGGFGGGTLGGVPGGIAGGLGGAGLGAGAAYLLNKLYYNTIMRNMHLRGQDKDDEKANKIK